MTRPCSHLSTLDGDSIRASLSTGPVVRRPNRRQPNRRRDEGDTWTAKVDGSLESVAFFIPVMTPRYFQSTECRRELRFFVTQARRLGLTELIMPLLYVDVPALHDETPLDDLVGIVKLFHWEEWTDLRFVERGSAAYQRAVANLATRLARANVEAAQSASAPLPASNNDDDPGDAPGIMDRMAMAEASLPGWSATVQRVGEILEDLGDKMTVASEDIAAADRQGKGFAGRVAVARRLGNDLDGSGDEVLALSSTSAEQLNDVDTGIRAIIESAPDSVNEDPTSRDDFLAFFENIREMASSVDEGLGSIEEFLGQMEPIERMS